MILVIPVLIAAGCGARQREDELAVDKLPLSQVQSAPFVALNDDKPGTPVDLRRYLAPGKYTIVEYYSPFSNDSVMLEHSLHQLVTAQQTGFAVRAINVNRPGVQGIDWQSPIVQEQGITTLPYFQIYDPHQGLRAHGRPAYEQVLQMLRRR
jgi:hypothetical protein